MAEVCVSLGDSHGDADIAPKIRSLLFRMPAADDKIFKDECMYCFKTPMHPGGLFICLERFAGLCIDHVKGYCERTARKGFLWYKQTKKALPESEEPQDKVKKLAIGVEGGFCSGPKFEILSEYAIVIYPNFDTKIALNRAKRIFRLTSDLSKVCTKMIESDGVQRVERLEAGVSAWDGEAKVDTKHANLEQLNNGKKVPCSGWKCEEEGCDLTENLWLNLTDGAVKCGRSQYIQEGVMSKGRNHMRQHFDKTGYPLVVKLGTITKNDADVFSYDEDDSVRDPNLRQHLMHFGIDMETVEKTEKSTLEMELDLNQRWEWAMCQEDGANLELAYGPGLTGIINVGSSCYINATLQMLLQIPDFVTAYGKECEEIFLDAGTVDSHDDFNCQTAKVFSSLLSGEFSKKDSEYNSIKPTQFRRVVGRGHPEFSTAKQQDADEYIRYFLAKVDENLKKWKPVDAVRLKLEQRLEDKATGRVRYSNNEEVVLSLVVPEKSAPVAAVSSEHSMEMDVPARPTVSFAECLSSTFAEQHIADFRSPITNEVKGAIQQCRISTFPDFLIIQLKKFTVTSTWTVKKMDVNVEMPDEIDLGAFRGHGKQPNEKLFPARSTGLSLSQSVPDIDLEVVNQLCGMGFTPEASRRAVYMTKNTGIQAASTWIMDHITDPDINEEHPDLMSKASAVDRVAIEQLTNLGFSAYQARYALQKVNSGINAAADWLFANVDTIPPEKKEEEASDGTRTYRDGKERYRLVGFISHMGSSPHSGHYVAHMKKDSKWYLFNDEKVAISQNPPTSLGYIYLYQRC